MNADIQDSVVVITSSDTNNTRFGTGFIIHRNQDLTYLLTCAHVVQDVGGKDKVEAEYKPVKVVAMGEVDGFDLAVLQVWELLDRPTLKLELSGQRGQKITIAGFHSQAKNRVLKTIKGKLGESGELTAKDESKRPEAWDLEIDQGYSLEPGYSGSPVVDQFTQRVLGIVSQRQGEKKGFAISVEALEILWPEIPPSLIRKTSLPIPSPPRLPKPILIASLVITSLIFVVRFLGILQTLELKAFDYLLQLKPADDLPDQRLLLILITNKGSKQYGRGDKEPSASLPDNIYEQLFTKLEQYQPRTIGLDIYRDFSVKTENNKLREILHKDHHLFTICKVSDRLSDKEAIAPPPEVPPKRWGFSDFVTDPDGVVRRHLLQIESPINEGKCRSKSAFSLQLALHYLNNEQQQVSSANETLDENYQIRGVTFSPIGAFTGGYQDIEAREHQVLLNYRSLGELGEIADTFTLDEILTGEIGRPIAELQDRIILIGIDDNLKGDQWLTPYGEEKVPGVIIHAHMVSQILDVVEGKRSLLWVWPQGLEIVWILSWSFVGGMLAWRLPRFSYLAVANCFALIIISSFCYVVFWKTNGWLPSLPPALGVIFTGAQVYTNTKLSLKPE